MEKVITRLIVEMGFTCPSPGETWKSGYLFEYADEHAHQHLTINTRGGVIRRLTSTDDWGVLDRVYKVDLLVRQYTGELWALQLTTNVADLAKKHKQLLSTETLRKSIGINRTALIYIQPPASNWGGLAMTTRPAYDQLEECIYTLFEAIEAGEALYYQLDLSWLR
jgi:hypothetical protein